MGGREGWGCVCERAGCEGQVVEGEVMCGESVRRCVRGVRERGERGEELTTQKC